jgi:hypothetical protein
MSSLRWRAALAGAAVLTAVLPAAAGAFAPPLTCRDVVTVSDWQRIPIERFTPIEGVTSSDVVSSYSLAARAPRYVTVTNGKRLQVSDVSGCAWDDGLTLGAAPTGAVPLSGTTSTIVSTATLSTGRVLAAVREGSGPASRPHIVGSDNGRTGYQTHDGGLPPQGAPRLLEAADDGRTVYLVIAPSSGAGDDPGGVPLPGIPDVNSPTSGAKTGLLYGSTDAGRTWTLRTTAGDLPAGGGGLDQLAVDRSDANRLYAVSNGLLLVSRDGGGTFQRAKVPNDDVTSVATGPGGYVLAFTSSGRALVSTDGLAYIERPAPGGVTSAAYRGDTVIAVEAKGELSLENLSVGQITRVNGLTVKPGSLRPDVSTQATFHALSGHALLRYADRPPRDAVDPPVAIGDLGVPPPPPGTISPANRKVQLKVGTSTVVDYTLQMPKSPTPLDLMFLVDTSSSMDALIEDLKRNIGKATATIQRAGIDLRVGLATVGTGSENAYAPNLDPTKPTQGPPKLYQLLRKIGRIDPEFASALASVHTTTPTSNAAEEAQVIGLEQAAAGMGVPDPRFPAGTPVYLVPPGLGAQWRPDPSIRRLIVHASDEKFAKPAGTPLKNGEADIDHAVAVLNDKHVKQLGLSLNSIDSAPDLRKVAQGTRTLAPPGGAACGDDDEPLPAGAPLVCPTERDFSAVIGQLVRSFTDRQDVSIVARGSYGKLIGTIDAARMRAVDVTKVNTLPFRVAVTCKGSSPGTYTEDLAASLRGVRIATTHLTVECLGPAAAARLLPPVAVAPLPAPAPVPPAPVAVVPAPPAAQPQAAPQGQAQAQAQMNPMTAAAMQRQEQLQLALALQAGTEIPDTDEQTELAMVGSRREDEPAALALLATAILASSAFGLARLRHRPEPTLARAWQTRR